jgi:hypothetical protein
MSSLLRGSSEQEAFGQLHRVTPPTSGDLMTWLGKNGFNNAALLAEYAERRSRHRAGGAGHPASV